MAELEVASGKGRRNRCAAFVNDRRGATAVEFALVAAPFLGLLFALIHTFLVFFAQQLLESVVPQSSRQILTGQVQSQQLTKDAFHQIVCDKVVILFNCSGLMVDVQVASSWSSADTSAPTLTYDAHGQVTNMQFNPGNPGDIVVVRVMYLWPVFMFSSQGSQMIMATAAFQNEP
jgi:Flp pilus assembly protein TadG